MLSCSHWGLFPAPELVILLDSDQPFDPRSGSLNYLRAVNAISSAIVMFSPILEARMAKLGVD